MRNPFRRRRPRDEGSMPMALLVTMVAMSLTATLVPVVVRQFTTTRTADSRTVALDAAQIGIDVALGQLRAAGTAGTATDGTPIMKGVLESLPPCTFTGSQDSGGMLNAKNSLLYYGVRVAYYGVPDDATDPTPALLPCPPVSVPTTAVITATGSGSGTATLTKGAAGTRTLEATYTFKTNNENITGGAVKLAAPTSPQQLCMDGGADATPAAGTAVMMQWCKGGTSDQRFAYTADLNLKLVGSETGVAPNGMCLDAPLPHTSKDPVTFQPCLGRSARQQWSLNNSGNFQGTSDGVNLDSSCLNLKTAGAPDVLIIDGCGGTANKQVFRPEAKVGAGMASGLTHQLVNYKQFSRCLDVTNHVATSGYMIVWFCKQDPSGNVSWNQQWSLPAISLDLKNATKERIRTAGSGNPGYCLRTPDAISGYVTMKPCPVAGSGPIPEKNMEWVVYGDTGNPVTSYRIVDTNGYCLTPTDLTVATPDTHSDGTAKVKVAPCTGDELQKWNAPPYFNAPLVLTNTKEK
ncbi:RICIN domain-containing protein [Nucisporomicrobium flavum]|uniref:RICIN domain-containing protein n=1 Tax=Nucisporomicrobium flavum TaxID=2785915 RepID=UPI003C2DBD17